MEILRPLDNESDGADVRYVFVRLRGRKVSEITEPKCYKASLTSPDVYLSDIPHAEEIKSLEEDSM